jgi:hypothetical protein
MNLKTLTLVTLAFLCAATLVPAASAQAPPNSSSAWRGQDNEFGSIRAPYTADLTGARVPVEAQVVLRKNFEDKDGRFYMFAFTVENTPLDVTFDHLVRADTGAEMPCYQKQGTSRDQLKCFVDLRDMPPAGTEILMKGTVGSKNAGTFQVGMIVVPFTATWTRVQMSNGLDAELYGYTQVNVAKGAAESKGIAGMGNGVPGLGMVGVVAAGAVAVGLLALRRRG